MTFKIVAPCLKSTLRTVSLSYHIVWTRQFKQQTYQKLGPQRLWQRERSYQSYGIPHIADKLWNWDSLQLAKFNLTFMIRTTAPITCVKRYLFCTISSNRAGTINRNKSAEKKGIIMFQTNKGNISMHWIPLRLFKTHVCSKCDKDAERLRVSLSLKV